MKKTSSILLAAAILVSLPHNLFAWGKKGHGIVAEIAFTMLDSNTKTAVYKYLGATTIEQASTWMDEVRSDHRYDYMKTWHYVNVEKGSEYIPNKDANVINALNNAIDELGHKDKLPDSVIKTDLMVIFHLVGDMHQPLHVGYGTDKGGNDIRANYLTHPSNLHKIWDTEIIESEAITTDQCLALYKDLSKKEIAKLKDVNIEVWMQEPRALLPNVYDFNTQENNIDQAYIDKNKKIIEQQLLIAGIRLSAVLEKVFKS